MWLTALPVVMMLDDIQRLLDVRSSTMLRFGSLIRTYLVDGSCQLEREVRPHGRDIYSKVTETTWLTLEGAVQKV